MKIRASTLPFFLACLLLEMRNALLANGLKEFSRGKLTDSWEHLPLFREAAYSGAKKQTASNTEDTASYVAERFNGMISRSTNPRQLLQESKAQVPSKMQKVDEGSDYTRKRRSLSDTRTAESAPRDVKAVPYNSSAVKLTWQEPINIPTQEESYYIYYGTVQNGVSSVPVGSTRAKSYFVGNLQQSVVYVFQVSLGLTGQHSETVNSRPKSDQDYQPVHSLKAVVVNASSIVLTWEKPPDIANPSGIKGYQITMSYTADGGHKTELLNATMTGSTFRFLDFNTRYTFEVRTRFSKDNSLGPPVHVIKTTDAFTAPVGHLTAKAGYYSVILTWSAPGTIKPTALKLYMVHWNCTDCYYGQRNGDQACPRTNCTIPNLQRGHRYSFSVHAVTDFGDGESSVISMLISRYYGKVRNLQAIVDNDYNMTIKWDPPINVDVKDIKYYIVRWCKTDDTESLYCGYYGGGYNSIRVNETTNFKLAVMAGSKYFIRVYAVTGYGQGSYSYLQKTVPPLNLKVSSAYSYMSGAGYGLQVYVHWYRPYWYSGPVQYEVRWQCVRSGSSSCWYSSWTTRVVNSTYTYVNVSRYGTAYEFEITIITSHGRGLPRKLIHFVPPLNGTPRDFSCKVAADSVVLTCYWSPPTDFNPAGFNYYWFQYKCDHCQYSYFHYKQIYGLNTTSTNVSVSRGAQWTAMLQVSTIYGNGKYAQITLVTTAVVNPVTDLNVILVGNTKNVVHLSWKAPSNTSDIQNYLVITKRHRYSFNTIRNITSDTNLFLTLPCGNTYDFTVKAQTTHGTSADSKISLEIKPSVKAVTNLAVNVIGGEDTSSTDWTKASETGFLLTWNAPPDVKAADIKYYEIIVTNLRTGELVDYTKTDAKATSWTIKRRDHEDDLQPGEQYLFQVRCNALCGFGSSSAQVGLYHNTTRPTQSTTPWTHPSNCRSYEYKCHNGICIYMWDVCDGSDDCGDNSDEGWFCELLSSSSPSLAPPSAVVTYPSATYTSQLSSDASLTATKSPLYPSPTSYTSSATVTYASSTKKPFSSSHQSHSSDHIDRPFPYWAVATTAAAGAIIVFLVVYIVLKKCKKDRRTTLKYLQADYPQDMEESISEGDTPMLLENFTDDEILIRA